MTADSTDTLAVTVTTTRPDAAPLLTLAMRGREGDGYFTSPLMYNYYHLISHSTAQHSTAQHSTAQHSTAQHSTAQHSTAQHSTANRVPKV